MICHRNVDSDGDTVMTHNAAVMPGMLVAATVGTAVPVPVLIESICHGGWAEEGSDFLFDRPAAEHIHQGVEGTVGQYNVDHHTL